jgi:hypothetical protein
MKTTASRAVEMTGYGKRGKPKAGFPRFPQPLEIAKSAISTFPQPRLLPRGKVEIQKQDFHFPIAAFYSLTKQNSKRRIPLNAGFPVVQAHRSIRKCCARLLH